MLCVNVPFPHLSGRSLKIPRNIASNFLREATLAFSKISLLRVDCVHYSQLERRHVYVRKPFLNHRMKKKREKNETRRGMTEPTQEQHACMAFVVDCIDSLDRLSMLNLLNEDFLDLLLAIALTLDFLSTDENDMMLRCSLIEAITCSTSKTAQHLPDTLDKEGNQSSIS